MEEKQEAPASEETQVETPEEVEEEGQQEDESLEEYKARLQKAEELAENYKKRAEKAEKAAKELKQNDVETKDLSQNDLLFLAKADIHEDDINDLTTWAKNNQMSVKDAYNQFKPVLDARSEERKTAQATQTKSARGTKAKSGEDYLNKARQTGEVPESEEGLRDLIRARIDERRKR